MNVLSGLTDALRGLAAPVRALLVALLGAWWAWLWFSHRRWEIAVVAVAALIVVLVIDGVGRALPLNRAVLKVQLMEWWIVAPMVLAALAAATSIVVAVELTIPDTASAQTKETVGALATAITAFLSSGFVDWAADADDSRASDRIKQYFEDACLTAFVAGSIAERYVYSQSYDGASGWGRSARRVRAKGIESRWNDDKRSVLA